MSIPPVRKGRLPEDLNCKAIHISNRTLSDRRKITLHREIARISWPSKFVSYKDIILRKFDSKKDSQPMKLEETPQILVNLRFRESWKDLLHCKQADRCGEARANVSII